MSEAPLPPESTPDSSSILPDTNPESESGAQPLSEKALDPTPESSEPKGTENKRVIKIGSQRDEEKKFAPYVAEPHATGSPVAEEPKPQPIAEGAYAQIEKPAAPQAAAGSASPEAPAATGDAAGEATSDPADSASSNEPAFDEKGKRGSYPPPRLDKTTPDLEEEIALALGDLSLEDMMSGESGNAAEIEQGDRRHVRVVKMDPTNVFVAVDATHEGVIALRQFTDPPAVGDKIEVIIGSLSKEDGLYEAAIPGATMHVGDWDELEEGMVVEARVTGHNTGGLECQVGSTAGFIPGGQIALYHVDDFSDFVGQKLPCVVTEVSAERRKLVVSHRNILLREREEAQTRLLAELQEGQECEGIVRKILDFGAFVDIGGIDGLVHVSKLSWDRVEHPSDVVSEGQKVKVKVEKIDRETGKIGLSLRDMLEQPWADASQKFPLGSTVKGSVTKIADFGAFVRIASGIEGLVHISELAHYRVNRVNSVVSVGQEVEAKVLSVDQDAQRMSLSMKALMQSPAVQKEKSEAEEDIPAPLPTVEEYKGNLRGGTNRPTGGEAFGLKW